mgnify:CR=1 FL=1|tara:strand:+ start:466 stop:2079 length:1614 start_codon:yes stop_codon:yes gene_type:complete
MARFGSFGSGMAQGYLEQSALTQKRDAAAAEAKYRQATLDASALTQRIELTKSALDENAELITRAQDYGRQHQNDPNIVENTKTAIDGLVQQRQVLYGQLKQMGGLPDAGADPRAAALGSTPTAEDTFVVGRSIMGKTSGKKLGEAPFDDESAWKVQEGADGNLYRVNPVTDQSELLQPIEQAADISASNAVLKVDKNNGVTETWIHSSVMPKDHGQPVNPMGYVVAAEGGPAQSILKGSLFNPNPPMGPDGKPMPNIIPVDRNSLTLAQLEEYKDSGYFWVQDPTLDKEAGGTSGAEAATGFGGTDSQIGKAQESYTQNVVASAMTKQLFQQLHKAGPGVLGVPGFLREHVGGALGGMFAPIGLDGEAGFNELINFFTGGELTSDEVNNIRTKFKQMITPAVKAYTGEESGRITKEEREIGYKTLAATKAMRSITQARQALLGMLTLQESEQMRIRAMLGQEQLHDLTNFEQFSEVANKLYNDLGGEPGSENDAVVKAAVTQIMENLQIVQKAILAGVKPGGVLTDKKWAQSKAAN